MRARVVCEGASDAVPEVLEEVAVMEHTLAKGIHEGCAVCVSYEREAAGGNPAHVATLGEERVLRALAAMLATPRRFLTEEELRAGTPHGGLMETNEMWKESMVAAGLAALRAVGG